MKRNFLFLTIVFLMVSMLFTDSEKINASENNSPKIEMRAAWISTVFNIDLKSGMTEAEYTIWADETIKELERKNFNTIVFQVKPTADAFYPSTLAPWSRFITGGKQGTDPGYDPLQIMIETAQEYGLELHAWINPYRASTSGQTFDDLAEDNIIVKNPEWAVKSGTMYYLNPGIPEVQNYLAETVKELVTNYEIDAIHMDDYFYPGASFEDEETYANYGDGYDDIGDWRRNNVNELIRDINQQIKAIKPWVQFGISPSGIWRNDIQDPDNGSATNGSGHYDNLYADSLEWVREGYIDYLTPQIYWSRELSIASYSVLQQWWSNQTKSYPINLYIGMADYKINDNFDTAWDNVRELPEQVLENRNYGVTKGQMHFTLRDIKANPLGYADIIEEEIYNLKAITPSTPWNGNAIPEKPKNIKLLENNNNIEVLIEDEEANNTKKYVIYRSDKDTDIDYNQPHNIIGVIYNKGDITTFIDSDVNPSKHYQYGVTSISMTGIESNDATIDNWPPEVVDTSALQQAISNAEDKQQSNFTDDTWKVFSEALLNAQNLITNESASQEDVDDAVILLNEGIDQLELIPEDIVDITALKQAISNAEAIDESNYTEATWKVFSQSLSHAKNVIADESTSQEDVDDALKLLNEGIDQLELISVDIVDTSALQQAISNAEAIDKSNFTAASWKVFSEALIYAKETIENSQATQGVVDSALKDLEDAISNLVTNSNEDSLKEDKPDKEQADGETLPKTATHTFNLLLVGSLLFIIGTTIFLYKRRKLGWSR